MQWEIGIDMGTSAVRMAQREAGSLVRQRSDVAYYRGERQPFSWGDEAHSLAGRAHAGVRLARPVRDAALEEAPVAQFWLQWLRQQAMAAHHGRTSATLLGYAPGGRLSQEEALMRAALEAGAQEAGMVRTDVAGAIGAGLDVLAPGASFVLEIGAGHIAASVWTMGHLAAEGRLDYGMERVDERLRRALIANRGFSAGPVTLEAARRALGAADSSQLSGRTEARAAGFDLRARMTRVERLRPSDVAPAIRLMLSDVAFMLQGVIAQLPEELAADLIDSGLTVVGGGANLPGLERFLGEALEIPCAIAEEPEDAVLRGLHRIMRFSNRYDELVTERMTNA